MYGTQAIENLFADYYQELYNLEKSSDTSLISQGEIDSFLSKVSLPKLTQQQTLITNLCHYKKNVQLLNLLNF